MTEDALYLVDLFNMQIGSLQNEMLDIRINRDRFDRFSYSSWAIKETLKSINEYSGYVSVSIIREILSIQMTDYERFYSASHDKHSKFKHALDTIKYLYNLTGGYINE